MGRPTKILVLGTPHLGGTAEDWDPATLEPLLQRLANFRPDVITIEALSGASENPENFPAPRLQGRLVVGVGLVPSRSIAAGLAARNIPAALALQERIRLFR